jgi:hypothetical protein
LFDARGIQTGIVQSPKPFGPLMLVENVEARSPALMPSFMKAASRYTRHRGYAQTWQRQFTVARARFAFLLCSICSAIGYPMRLNAERWRCRAILLGRGAVQV